MLKRLLLVTIATILLSFQFAVGSASALKIDKDIRTVKLNEAGDTVVLSNKEYKKGQKKFVSECSKCHKAGATKSNPNVTLSLAALEGAEPPRDNIEGIVDYLQNPTSYDGEEEDYMSLLHPNVNRLDIYPELKNYKKKDLENVAGFILVQPKLKGILWGGGKVYN